MTHTTSPHGYSSSPTRYPESDQNQITNYAQCYRTHLVQHSYRTVSILYFRSMFTVEQRCPLLISCLWLWPVPCMPADLALASRRHEQKHAKTTKLPLPPLGWARIMRAPLTYWRTCLACLKENERRRPCSCAAGSSLAPLRIRLVPRWNFGGVDDPVGFGLRVVGFQRLRRDVD